MGEKGNRQLNWVLPCARPYQTSVIRKNNRLFPNILFPVSDWRTWGLSIPFFKIKRFKPPFEKTCSLALWSEETLTIASGGVLPKIHSVNNLKFMSRIKQGWCFNYIYLSPKRREKKEFPRKQVLLPSSAASSSGKKSIGNFDTSSNLEY